MKVVKNACFGGFGLSVEAIKELTLRDAKCIEKITPKKYYGGESKGFPCYAPDWEEKWNKDFPKEYKDIGDGFWGHEMGFHIYKDGIIYDYEDGDFNSKPNRADKDLVEVVEKMGEESFGDHAELTVVEIPDGTKIEFDEYDGVETIREIHRSW